MQPNGSHGFDTTKISHGGETNNWMLIKVNQEQIACKYDYLYFQTLKIIFYCSTLFFRA